eukprot:SAG31_NODE_1292_length_8967_cov_2.998985_4_plen_89_part_00
MGFATEHLQRHFNADLKSNKKRKVSPARIKAQRKARAAREKAEQLQRTFRAADTDGSGDLNDEELKQFLTTYNDGKPMPDEAEAFVMR